MKLEKWVLIDSSFLQLETPLVDSPDAVPDPPFGESRPIGYFLDGPFQRDPFRGLPHRFG